VIFLNLLAQLEVRKWFFFLFSFLIKILIVFGWRLIKAIYHLAKAEGSYKWPLVGGGDCVVDAAETCGVAGSQRSGSKHEQWISEELLWSGVKLIEENTEKERWRDLSIWYLPLLLVSLLLLFFVLSCFHFNMHVNVRGNPDVFGYEVEEEIEETPVLSFLFKVNKVVCLKKQHLRTIFWIQIHWKITSACQIFTGKNRDIKWSIDMLREEILGYERPIRKQ